MDFEKLVNDLVKKREEYIQILNELYSGNPEAVDELDSEIFNKRNRELFKRAAQQKQIKKTKRRSGEKPCYSHCASASYLASLLIPEGYDRDLAISKILFHPVISIVAKDNPNKFEKIRKDFGKKYRDELNSSILLRRPTYDCFEGTELSSIISERVATVVQVKEFGDRSHAIALVCDKLDNALDLDCYGEIESISNKTKYEISDSTIAYVLFAVEELKDKVPELVKPVEEICGGIIEKYSIKESMVREHLDEYRSLRNEYYDDLKTAINNHLSKFAYKRYSFNLFNPFSTILNKFKR